MKFICRKCKAEWYTANIAEGQKCDTCGGVLYRADISNEVKFFKEKRKNSSTTIKIFKQKISR